MTAHAVLAEQGSGITDTPVQGDVPRSVDEPGVDLREVVVDALPDGFDGVVIWGRIEQADLHFVVRLIRLDPQVVGLAGLDLPRDKGAERSILLVGALVQGTAFLVGVYGHGTWNDDSRGMNVWDRIEVGEVVAVRHLALLQFLLAWRAFLVEADPGADDRLDDLEIGTEILRPGSPVFDSIPVVGCRSGLGVVIVLDFVASGDNVQHLLARMVLKGQVRRLLGRVVRLRLQDQRARGEAPDRAQVNRNGHAADGRGLARQRCSQGRKPGVVRDRP